MPPKKTPKKKDSAERPSSSADEEFFPEWVTALLESQRRHAERQDQRYEQQVERLEQRHQEQIEHLSRIVSQSTGSGTTNASSNSPDDSDVSGTASRGAASAPDGPTVKAAHPPEKLARDISLRAFKSWRNTWEDYATLARLSRLPSAEPWIIYYNGYDTGLK